jgi:hypothetical protein
MVVPILLQRQNAGSSQAQEASCLSQFPKEHPEGRLVQDIQRRMGVVVKDIPFLLPGKPPKVSENEIQRAIFKHLRQRPMPRGIRLPSQERRHPPKGQARRDQQRLGVVSGVPDVIAIREGRVFGLELKTDFGKVSEEQLNALRAMQEAGAIVAVANGLNAALAKLEEWGLLRGVSA